jgi:hypothetical protein
MNHSLNKYKDGILDGKYEIVKINDESIRNGRGEEWMHTTRTNKRELRE